MAKKVGLEQLEWLRQELVSRGINKKSPFIHGAIDVELLVKDGFSTFWINESGQLTTLVVDLMLGKTRCYIFYSSNEEHLRQVLHAVVNWSDAVQLFGPPIWYSFVQELARTCAPEHNFILSSVFHCYGAVKDNMGNISLHPGFTLDNLHLEDAEKVDNCWEYREEGFSLPLFQRLIQHLPSVAVRDDQSNLVAFEVCGPFLNNLNLFVYPEHRRKGLGAAVTRELNRKMIAMWGKAYTYIVEGNEKSVELHTKCGFTRMDEGRMVWLVFKPGESSPKV